MTTANFLRRLKFSHYTFVLLIFCPLLSRGQVTTVYGSNYVLSGSEEYYEASFSTAPLAQSSIYWSVSGGTISEENINPTNGTIYCKVVWGSSGEGVVSVYEDLNSQSAERTVEIYQNLQVPLPPLPACSGISYQNNSLVCTPGPITVGPISGSTVSNWTSEGDFSWSGGSFTTTSVPTMITVNPSTTTVYTLEYKPRNLIPNGDFESGNANFSSGTTFSVNTNSVNVLPWGACTTLAHMGVGSMLCINGSYSVPNEMVWTSSSFAVQPNKQYQFQLFYKSIGGTPGPDLEFYFNGVRIQNGSLTSFPLQTNICSDWEKINFAWTSPSNTSSLVIEIKNKSAGGFNDFILDNIGLYANCQSWVYTVNAGNALQIQNSTLEYHRRIDGSPSYSNVGTAIDNITECGTNLLCFEYDNKLYFSLHSNLPNGNEWQMFRDNIQVDLTGTTATAGMSINNPNSTSRFGQHYTPDFAVYFAYPPYNYAPFTLEIRLINTSSSVTETRSIFLNIKRQPPPPSISYPVCNDIGNGWARVLGSNASWTVGSLTHTWIIPSSLTNPNDYTVTGNNFDYKLTSLATPQTIYYRATDPVTGCAAAASAIITSDISNCSTLAKKAKLTEEISNSNDLAIYPNPANKDVTITAGMPIKKIAIYSSDGKKLKEYSSSSESNSFSLADLSKGFYLIKILYFNGKTETRKLIKL